VVLVTHDAKVAARTGRILFMRDGKIVSELQLPKSGQADMDSRVKAVLLRMQELGI
jgi:putative ABC transport system ATP-binding protein